MRPGDEVVLAKSVGRWWLRAGLGFSNKKNRDAKTHGLDSINLSRDNPIGS